MACLEAHSTGIAGWTTLSARIILVCATSLGMLAGCTVPDPEGEPESVAAISCEGNRTYSCAQVYRPVCATRDNGIRCVTTPCDSTEEATYPNDCAACADERVYSYVPGECD